MTMGLFLGAMLTFAGAPAAMAQCMLCAEGKADGDYRGRIPVTVEYQ
ncbi:MAG: hypothetical protein KYX64_07320 [Sphingopyxis sp.]|nr:hypothetical protein [Sphingopyxis sp.]